VKNNESLFVQVSN